MHHPCALGSNYLESSTAHGSHQCPGLRENTVCSLSQTWKFQFYAATSALCVLTCVRGALLSISFPTFTELKDVSSKGKRRLLIVATPSLCPPKRMYMADQQGGGGVPARGHGHTHTHNRTNRGEGLKGGEAEIALTFLGCHREDPEELCLYFGHLFDESDAVI